MKNILFVIAMEKESKDIVKEIGLKKLNFEDIEIYKKENISLLISGIGKQRTAINLTKCIERLGKPDLIINVGYAGSTNEQIGSWVQVSKVYNYEWNIPGEERFSMPEFESGEVFEELANVKKLECYSAESFVTETEIKKSVLFDMELYSIFIICKMHKIKLISLKKVSDSLSLDDYYKNIQQKNIFELISCLNLLKKCGQL